MSKYVRNYCHKLNNDERHNVFTNISFNQLLALNRPPCDGSFMYVRSQYPHDKNVTSDADHRVTTQRYSPFLGRW